ncbi:MAG: hypothetical protein NT028_07015 [candidate division Zixibacteria bacterium]|nr:hypothetical protein [candidate division Zixibacteria bacterium]
MYSLSPGERYELVAEHVDKARLNWAHIAIAQLMACGYVDRVLTTNFDPLLQRACALLNLYPAIYDFAASPRFVRNFVPDHAIFHLHGQRTGFVQLHTEEELAKHFEAIAPVFEDAVSRGLWIIVGYSGDNDPVFKRLAEVSTFNDRLFWIGYKDEPAPPHVQSQLFQEGKYASYINGFDADSFFIKLNQELGCFPPAFVSKPFSHLLQALKPVMEYTIPGHEADIGVMEEPRKLIKRAVMEFERARKRLPKGPLSKDDKESLHSEIDKALMAGDYERAIEIGKKLGKMIPPKAAKSLAWAYVLKANSLSEAAKSKSSGEAEKLYQTSNRLYSEALKIVPKFHEALYNWGTTLFDQAKAKTGAEADQLYALASGKYKAALKINPDQHKALNNWGAALHEQAKARTGADADRLYALAADKYETALKILPHYHTAWNNWGAALSDQAKAKTGAEADRLFAMAAEKYDAALKIKPDDHETLYNWGTALSDQAEGKAGAEADRLFAMAAEKYEAALKIKPSDHEALYNWGLALFNLARAKTGAEADRLFAMAAEKYEAVLQIKPDYYKALNNWGAALYDRAKAKTGAEADRLYTLAAEKYEAALKIKPDLHESLINWSSALSDQAKTKTGEKRNELLTAAEDKCNQAESLSPGSGAYNLACVASLRGRPDECRKWLEISREAGELPRKEKLKKDIDLDPVRELDWFKAFMAGLKE